MQSTIYTLYTGTDGRYKYLEHLKVLERQNHASSRTMMDPQISILDESPLNAKAWEKRLSHHPDRDFADYIVNGIQKGFRLGINPEATYSSASRNMQSAILHQGVVDEYLKKEVEQGNILGPFPKETAPNVHINRFGVIPKKHQVGKWRLITDLSFPEGSSINDGIDTTACSLSYVTVQEVAHRAVSMGKGSLLAKIDIKSAYRLIPVSPLDRTWLGMCWKEQIYVDSKLPFDLRSAPKIFNALADALEWCMVEAGVQTVYHYLDDFIVVGPPSSEICAEHLQILHKVCNDLGVPLAQEKQEGPDTTITFLGITIDTINQELRLPEEKLKRLLETLSQWEQRKSCTRKELESLIGSLQHACTVIQPGRSFMRSAIPLLKVAKCQHHHIRLSTELRSDLAWWRIFARHWNGTALVIPHNAKRFEFTSDASGSWGSGAWYENYWFNVPWTETCKRLHITVKEMAPIVVATIVWGHTWKGGQVTVFCDNTAVVAAITNRSCKEKHVMRLLRVLFFVEAHYQFTIAAKYIPGPNNTLADHLSRNQHGLFLTMHKTAHSKPTYIAPSLLQWLMDPLQDWTSPVWTQQFNSFVRRA